MLPSMPVLFSRDSEDAFGNKIEPSTSFFNANWVAKPAIKPEPPPLPCTVTKEPVKVVQKEPKSKGTKKKEEPPKFDNNALETALVKSYYTKVQSRFSSNPSVPNNKFIQFQNILKTFDPSKETPVELYKKIEKLCGEEHKDILEDFLLFLKPGQAAEVGCFMDHFMMDRLNGFIELLHRTFYRKPTVLRKILRALTTGLNSDSSEQMKTRVLPHLRSNPLLVQLFKSLFPDERPPDSAYENATDTINESFLTADTGYDVWEFQEESNNKRKLDVKEGLDTMYLHGRVFLQHGRLLRSASVTYPYSKEPYRVHTRRLAPAHCHLSPPDSGDERSSPKRANKNAKATPRKTKKQLKSPVKNMKDVNDNTKLKDCAVTNIANSPKTTKIKAQNNKKNCKKEDANNKRDRKDNRAANCQKKEESSKAKQAKVEPPAVITETKIAVTKNNSWTRDEDKTMLQVIKCEADSEVVFGRIGELLPHRSVSEIKERFCHVMSLLQQMAVGEVT
ncbi:unnamed protein product [Chilo suppressalis]|uniref:Myb-like domain-containing protein n=1 Tax=Chilo suppressalis TaxID=168631 RepID=A0ABN8B6D9_CHISP|nr:unnamed protein product [Chilo suppressalis]